MADEKIVTKKTVAKPAASTNPTPAADAGAKKTVTKKTAPKAAAPQPPITKAAAAAAAAKVAEAQAPEPAAPAQPAATKATSKKVAAKEAAPAPVARSTSQRSLEEKPVSLQHLTNVTPQQRYEMVREAAYYKAEKRNFAAGNDAQDWVDAEREIDELLAKARQIFGG